MRDPNRIEPIIACLRGIWYQVPDWRFGQLMSNLMGQMYDEAKIDPFHIEDDKFLEMVNTICKKWGLEDVRATVYAEPWKERCHDCAYLVEDDNGEWVCEHYEMKCKHIKECWDV